MPDRLFAPHKEMVAICLDRETARFKEIVGQKFTDLIYNGWWFSELREPLQAFIERTQTSVTGDIVFRLYKGTATPIRRRSPYSLYDKKLATYDTGDTFQRESAVGFIDIYGLPLRVQAGVNARKAKAASAKPGKAAPRR